MSADISPKNVAKMLDEIHESKAGRSVRLNAQAMIRALDARVAELEASLALVTAGRDHWKARAEAAEASSAQLEAHIEGVAKDTHKLLIAAEAENARLREYFDAVEAFDNKPLASDLETMIERVNRARAVIQPKEPTDE